MSAIPIYETPCGRFWVRRADKRKGKDMGFEVFEHGVTCSARCAIIGFTGSKGFRRAMAEADHRAAERREAL